SLILGLGVRLIGVLGVIFVLHLWLGIYRPGSPAEWPWEYIFLAMVMFFFALHAAGRSLRLDAWLRRNVAASRDRKGFLGPLFNTASYPPTTRNLSPGAQPREQLRGRPAIGRQAELELRVADGDATLEAEHAVDAADVVAALFQKLLQLARFLEGEFRNVRAAPVHGRRAVEARGVVGRHQRIVERLVPLQIGLEVVVGEESRPEPSQG